MATYKKALKSITVKTLGGTTVAVADTADKPYASDALRDFEAFGIMHIKGEEKTTLIPFHAVDSIEVTSTTGQATKGDPYGC